MRRLTIAGAVLALVSLCVCAAMLVVIERRQEAMQIEDIRGKLIVVLAERQVNERRAFETIMTFRRELPLYAKHGERARTDEMILAEETADSPWGVELVEQASSGPAGKDVSVEELTQKYHEAVEAKSAADEQWASDEADLATMRAVLAADRAGRH